MSIRTKILKIKGDWTEVLNDCRATVGKSALTKEPSIEFKKRILIAEHSPIRDIIIKWFWEAMPHWVTVHFVRHKWEKFVRSQREDRSELPCPRDELPQGEPQNFTGEANTQHLIDTSRKRLCFEASPKTRQYWENLKVTIHDEVDEQIADVMVPNCVYRCGCPEMGKCQFWNYLMTETEGKILTSDIQRRYDLYNELFYAKEGEQNG